MKKIFTLLFVCFAFFGLNAQVFSEDFGSATVGGDLEGYNGWYVSKKTGDDLGASPKIAAGALTYPGYDLSGKGNVVVLDSINGSTSNQRISTRIIQLDGSDLTAVVGEKIYTSFLVKVSRDSRNSVRDFFTYEGSSSSSMTRGRVFYSLNSEGVFKFGISKNTGTAANVVTTDEQNIDDTHLLVLVYETIDGAENDILTLYYNPDLSKTEAEQTKKIVATDKATDYSATAKLGINIRQRGIGAHIGGIHVAKSWAAALTPTGVSKVTMNNSQIKAVGKTIFTGDAGSIRVFNTVGAELINQRTQGSLDTQLNKGFYVVRFADETGKVSSNKIFID